MEKLESFLNGKRARLLVISDVASLFLDKDLPKTEAKDFSKSLRKAFRDRLKKASYRFGNLLSRSKFQKRLIFETVLFGRSTVIVKFERGKKTLNFVSEDHPHIKPFAVECPTDEVPLTNYMEA